MVSENTSKQRTANAALHDAEKATLRVDALLTVMQDRIFDVIENHEGQRLAADMEVISQLHSVIADYHAQVVASLETAISNGARKVAA